MFRHFIPCVCMFTKATDNIFWWLLKTIRSQIPYTFFSNTTGESKPYKRKMNVELLMSCRREMDSSGCPFLFYMPAKFYIHFASDLRQGKEPSVFSLNGLGRDTFQTSTITWHIARSDHKAAVCSHPKIYEKKRNAPLRTVQLSGRSQGIGQFSL